MRADGDRRPNRLVRLFGPRAMSFFLVAALVGVPAFALRLLCVGRSCAQTAVASDATPFCSLPKGLRERIQNGFRDIRAPELSVVTGDVRVQGASVSEREDHGSTWPSVSDRQPVKVPLVLGGVGIDPGTPIPSGTGVEDVADTLAQVMKIKRSHPEVRSGVPITGVASGDAPRVVLEVVIKGVGAGSVATAKMPALRALERAGTSSYEVTVNSLPLDPAAIIATIGTGGLPSEHGVTASVVRDYTGRLTSPWPAEAVKRTAYDGEHPGTIIAGLGDHLDEVTRQEARIGIVGSDVADRGLTGGSWFPDTDRDDVQILRRRKDPGSVAAAAAGLLRSKPYGNDRVPDLLGVVFDGDLQEVDRGLAEIMRAALDVAKGQVAVLAIATGPTTSAEDEKVIEQSALRRMLEGQVEGAGELIEATVPGGIFVDQKVLSRKAISDDPLVDALLSLEVDGEPLFADVFPSRAVSFARYC